mgnify:FL=1|jgi:hypothetical protein
MKVFILLFLSPWVILCAVQTDFPHLLRRTCSYVCRSGSGACSYTCRSGSGACSYACRSGSSAFPHVMSALPDGRLERNSFGYLINP